MALFFILSDPLFVFQVFLFLILSLCMMFTAFDTSQLNFHQFESSRCSINCTWYSKNFLFFYHKYMRRKWSINIIVKMWNLFLKVKLRLKVIRYLSLDLGHVNAFHKPNRCHPMNPKMTLRNIPTTLLIWKGDYATYYCAKNENRQFVIYLLSDVVSGTAMFI